MWGDVAPVTAHSLVLGCSANREDALARLQALIHDVAESLVVKEMTAEQAKKQRGMCASPPSLLLSLGVLCYTNDFQPPPFLLTQRFSRLIRLIQLISTLKHSPPFQCLVSIGSGVPIRFGYRIKRRTRPKRRSGERRIGSAEGAERVEAGCDGEELCKRGGGESRAREQEEDGFQF
jgi:hypothetical protein